MAELQSRKTALVDNTADNLYTICGTSMIIFILRMCHTVHTQIIYIYIPTYVHTYSYIHNIHTYVPTYVTRSDKIGLIAEKYTCSIYGSYQLISRCNQNFVYFIQFLRIFCIYGEVLIKMPCLTN